MRPKLCWTVVLSKGFLFPLRTSLPPQRQRPYNWFKLSRLFKQYWKRLKDTFKGEFGLRTDLCKIINGATWLFIELEIKLDSRQSFLVHMV
jgi:hypothetical protein